MTVPFGIINVDKMFDDCDTNLHSLNKIVQPKVIVGKFVDFFLLFLFFGFNLNLNLNLFGEREMN